jgi:hypothetical protein
VLKLTPGAPHHTACVSSALHCLSTQSVYEREILRYASKFELRVRIC